MGIQTRVKKLKTTETRINITIGELIQDYILNHLTSEDARTVKSIWVQGAGTVNDSANVSVVLEDSEEECIGDSV